MGSCLTHTDRIYCEIEETRNSQSLAKVYNSCRIIEQSVDAVNFKISILQQELRRLNNTIIELKSVEERDQYKRKFEKIAEILCEQKNENDDYIPMTASNIKSQNDVRRHIAEGKDQTTHVSSKIMFVCSILHHVSTTEVI